MGSGLHDARVSFWEPAKFAAKVRELATNKPLVMLSIEGAGHFGASGVYSALRQKALKFGYLLRATCALTAADVSMMSGDGGGDPGRSESGGICIPCLAVFIVVVAGFGGLSAAVLYYGWDSVLRGWRRAGEVGIREVAMQAFGRTRGGSRADKGANTLEGKDAVLDRRRNDEPESEHLIRDEEGR